MGRSTDFSDAGAEEIARLKESLSEMGVESADVTFELSSGSLRPIVKSVRVNTSAAIASVASADPGNIQEVAASQLAISNDYYENVLIQARRSFVAAIVAASVGLLFFLAAIGFVLLDASLNATLTTTLSGAIVEVIAGLNFWLYGKTAKQLEAFHVRLEQTQRFLLANSLCHYLSDSARDDARANLVKIIGGPIAVGNENSAKEEGRLGESGLRTSRGPTA